MLGNSSLGLDTELDVHLQNFLFLLFSREKFVVNFKKMCRRDAINGLRNGQLLRLWRGEQW